MKLIIEDINDYNEINYMVFSADMDFERQEKALSYRNQDDYRLCVLADNLSKRMISEHSDIDMQMIAVFCDANGKPRCLNCPAKFNISHSGTKVACAVGDNEVGVDIEINKPHPERTVERFATESEKEYIALAEENFLKIWVLKEAFVKCTGEGIRGNFKDVEFTVDNNNNVKCSIEGYEAKLYSDVPGYTVATVEKIG